jgi:hypothetical protein
VTLRAPEPLAAQHRLEGFDCGKPALNDWLLRHARQAQGSGSAKTFVVAEDDGRVAGYFSLTVGQVDTLEAPERIRKGMGQYPLPVVILARLAVSVARSGARHRLWPAAGRDSPHDADCRAGRHPCHADPPHR